MVDDTRAQLAVQNSADWYEAVFTAHGLSFERTPYAFVGGSRPPRYYSNLVVLDPTCRNEVVARLSELAERFDGEIGLKDSFCTLDLEPYGFRTLFEASWIWRAPRDCPLPDGWTRIEQSAELAHWEDAWKRNGSPTPQTVFPDAMLAQPGVVFLGRRGEAGFEAGCIANRSEGCMGLSNVFAERDPGAAFSQAADAVASLDGALPTVGYESGADLDHALAADFETVGPLRVLVSDGNASFAGRDAEAG